MKTNSPVPVQQLIHYGIRLVEEDQAEAARPFFEKALERDPNNLMALLWLAGVGDNAADSYRYLARALDIDPDNLRAHAAIRWNHWREQDEKMHAAGFETARTAAAKQAKQSGASRTTPSWLGMAATLIVVLVALASIYLGQPLPAAANVASVEPVSAQVAQINTTTPPPLATRTLPAPAATVTPAATPTLPPVIFPTETPLPPTSTPEPPTATPEPPAPVVTNPTGLGGVRWIDVDLSNQRLVAYEGDTPVYWVTVSTGLPGTPTVTGQYHIYVKYLAQTMSGPGYYLPNVPYVMYFYQGYGIHGTYWHNNFGHPMSHGCVNAPTPDAQWLYNWADVGTLVNVRY